MRQTKVDRWSYETAAAVGETDRGFAVLRITGVITPAVSLQILGDNHSWLEGSGARSQVVDYSRTSMVINPGSMLRNVERVLKSGRGLRAPTAIVVADHMREFFDTYARMMAGAGILRGVFTDRERAHEWAATQCLALAELREESARRGLPAHQVDAGRHPPCDHAQTHGRRAPGQTMRR